VALEEKTRIKMKKLKMQGKSTKLSERNPRMRV
jgi:hypothetical protein